jgi:hypothetical protein
MNRRSFLRGAGVTLSLPWLESLAKANSAPPVRLAMLYMPNGVNPQHWSPTGSGANFTLSKTLSPLENLKSNIVVLKNLWNEAAKGGDGHYVKESAILTCATIKKTPGADIANGISMDQVAARHVSDATPLPSLELGVTPVAIGVDAVVGYTRIYGSHIAWSSPTTPLARELNPRAVYERLYRAANGTGAESAALDRLLLDRVQQDAKRLRAQVSISDRHRLDEYLSVMRSLEQRVERAADNRRQWKPLAPLPSAEALRQDHPQSHAEHVRLMLDMIAVAFQTDTTRVATFMFGNAVSNVDFRFLDGVTSAHHDVSHHGKDAEKLRQYQLINEWHVAQYAYLLRRLRDMKEGDSNVLANSMVLFGSALQDGDRHWPHNLPLVLGGGGGGRILGGQHLEYAEDTPLANLYVAMLDAFGTKIPRFADSTGTLPGLLRS